MYKIDTINEQSLNTDNFNTKIFNDTTELNYDNSLNMINNNNSYNNNNNSDTDTDFYINKMIGGNMDMKNLELSELIDNLSDASSNNLSESFTFDDTTVNIQNGGNNNEYTEVYNSESESDSISFYNSELNSTENQNGGYNSDSELSNLLHELSNSNNQLGGNNSNTDSELLELLNNLEYN